MRLESKVTYCARAGGAVVGLKRLATRVDLPGKVAPGRYVKYSSHFWMGEGEREEKRNINGENDKENYNETM